MSGPEQPSAHPAAEPPITVGAASEIGQREENQDYMTGFSSPLGAVYLIADGMGGHRGGAVASRTAADALQRHLLTVPASSPPADALRAAVQFANTEIREKGAPGDHALQNMGSTVVIALIHPAGAGMVMNTAHVGDSRAYLYRGGQLQLLTKDHTQVQWMIDSKTIDEAAARNHPSASVLTRALGHAAELLVDVSDPIPVFLEDRVLLCSDGLSGFATFEAIQSVIQQNSDPGACANALVQLALQSGSDDNITVQVLRIAAGGNPPPVATSRKTQPEGTTLPPPPAPVAQAPPGAPVPAQAMSTTTVPSRPVRKIAIAAAAFVCVTGITAWFVVRHRPVPVDPAVAALARRIHDFRAAATDLHTQAAAAKAAAQKSGSELQDATNSARRRARTNNGASDLKNRFARLSSDYDGVLTDSDRLEQEDRDLEQEFDALGRRPETTVPIPGKQTGIDHLKEHLQAAESDLQADQKRLNDANAARKELEARSQKPKAATKPSARGG